MMTQTKEKVQKLPDEHRQVLNVIINAPNKHITKEKILNQLGYEKNSTNERWVRRVISDLSTYYGYPIGCNYSPKQKGYFMITTYDEKVQAIKSLTSLIEGSIRRREAIKNVKVKE
ncbi:pathogenicity island protein [Staphylococcus simulans]|uniref:pathogenicity island protein n=1 Tax=Staphylococcus simulans TaxID=1286 RepID=UPI0018F879BD|nr:pathogenicity island protein [Staphylococcus simulans]